MVANAQTNGFDQSKAYQAQEAAGETYVGWVIADLEIQSDLAFSFSLMTDAK